MKLKGKNSERIPKSKKIKMEKTLSKMQKIRKEDSIHLREIIKEKLKWAIAEKEKAIKMITANQENINKLKAQLLQLEGGIIALNDILNPEKEVE